MKIIRKIWDWIYWFIIFKTARDAFIKMYGFEEYRKSLNEWLKENEAYETARKEFKKSLMQIKK